MDLAVIDLDGVVADSSARFARARRPDGSIDWNVAFDPALVSLDTLIEDIWPALDRLISKGYEEIVFLTSRPESMRTGTQQWLDGHALNGYELIMKPASAQFTKTVNWKADEVARLASIADVRSLLFIDDEPKIREAVQAAVPGVTVLASLADLIDDRPIII